MARPSVISCAVFGGRSPKTGKLVGERHRWSGGAWGEGHCVYCGRDLEAVLEKPKVERSLSEAVAMGVANADPHAWRPSFWDGKHGIAKGWYVNRTSKNFSGPEWLLADGQARRFETEADAQVAIAAKALAEADRISASGRQAPSAASPILK